ncbi:DUF5711 family protein [Candidatus Epulonipiscium viviparus]|uniref:DUF5711 family protein n=1 Tax=Candidatus Epulonipiscium viviparus TaxID=420336 RepID=UPI00016C009C|nr:DUF5711 family protein [Candidatus Epulopiscium viviparus]
MNTKDSIKVTLILTIFAIAGIVFIIFNALGLVSIDQQTLTLGSTIYQFNPTQMEKVILNENQAIYISKDGIRAFSKDGAEVWSNTLSFNDIIIRKNFPYFALSEPNGNKIIVFSTKGKLYELIFKNKIANFSINTNGEVAVIEVVDGGHIVSAYSQTGRDLGVSSGSFTSNGDYPMVAVVSPDGEYIIVSSLYLNGPTLESTIGAISVHKPKEVVTNPMFYANKESKNLVYNIEFISENIFASIGDKFLTFYNINGQLIRQISLINTLFKVNIDEMTPLGGFVPIVTATPTTHAGHSLVLLNEVKEYIVKLDFDAPINYFNANSSGVVIGGGLIFKGYNRVGKEIFQFIAKQNVQEVLFNNYMAIAVTNNSIIRLITKGGN